MKKGFAHLMKPMMEEKLEPTPTCSHMSSDLYPEIKDWKVGETYQCPVRVMSMEKREDGSSSVHVEMVTKKASAKSEDKTEY